MPKVSMQRPQLPPSCAGLVSRLAYERATQEGVNARELRRQAGLTVADIRESSTRLSVPSQIRFVELLERMNRGGKETLIVPSEYLEAVITKP